MTDTLLGSVVVAMAAEARKELETLRANVAGALKVLRANEWRYREYAQLEACSTCGAPKKNGHRDDCRVSAAIAILEGKEETG